VTLGRGLRAARPPARQLAAIAPGRPDQRASPRLGRERGAASPRRPERSTIRRLSLATACALAAALAAPAAAQGGPQLAAPAAAQGGPQLAALAPPPSPADDARRAVPIGPSGEVYEPDGKGVWVRRQQITTATTISLAARAGGAVVALGDGVVYRLAPNGWSAIRLAQKDKAKLAAGWSAAAAVGRQLLALDRMIGGEPAKLGVAPGEVLLLGAGRSIVAATDRGLLRIDGARLLPIAAPRRARMLVGDQWAIVDGGAVDLRTGRTTPWPAGASLELAAAGPDDRLIAVARAAGKLELLAVRAGKLERAPIDVAGAADPVGVAVDRAGHAVVAFRDGRIAVRDGATWTTVTVGEQLPPPHAGAPPAASR
jgi:hypothetical protein